MNVLILGSGGREHALAETIFRSNTVGRLYVAPGNPGCQEFAQLVPLDIRRSDQIVNFCLSESIKLVVVGPEAPLVAGVADALSAAGILCFGPSKAAARLEGSKKFTKELCRELGVPTADFHTFGEKASALAYLRKKGPPIVVKADGLAAGKGVTVAFTVEEAEEAIASIFDSKIENSNSQVLMEEYLEGEEASLFAICDGRHVLPFGGAQDHKRLGEGDTGPNTGGMGAYSPAPVLTDAVIDRAMREIVQPVISAMADRGTPFRGLLFAGLMITPAGPKLIEFNVRFGDPEAEVVLPRLDDDLLTFLEAAAKGRLGEARPKFFPKTALAVVLTAKGYPTIVEKGSPISGIPEAQALSGVKIYHAGVTRKDNRLVSDGGRVLAVTGIADSVTGSRALAYGALDRINLPGGYFRRDIGVRALVRDDEG